MSDMNQEPAASENSADPIPEADVSRQVSLPHDLPPVEPPSAGMIVQLFLVPAVIVAVIIGLYVLFGKMVSQDLDWRQLTTDVRSENPHVRWRGALGLAQMLDADAQRGTKSQQLSSRPEIASALAELYGELIQKSSPSEEELKQIEFLSKALGRMEVSETILPVLRNGMEEGRPHDIRKHSLIGLAMLAGTVSAKERPIQDSQLIDEVIEISRESDPLFRHQSTYTLGLLPTPAAIDRLQALLEDPDQMVRVNAAVGLARNDRQQGTEVFHELLREAAGWKLNPGSVKTADEESAYFERMLMVLNSLKAVTQLQSKLTVDERSQFAVEVQALIESTEDRVLQTEARQLEQLLN